MFFVLGFGVIVAISLTIVVNGLRKAPEAYEDEDGFHIVREHARGSKLSGVTRRTQDPSYGLVAENRA